MSQDKSETKVPKCPPQSELPASRLLWSGTIARNLGERPFRVVVEHVYVLPQHAKEWIVEPRYVSEIADDRDAMGNWRYTRVSHVELPAQFFVDALRAFDNAIASR